MNTCPMLVRFWTTNEFGRTSASTVIGSSHGNRDLASDLVKELVSTSSMITNCSQRVARDTALGWKHSDLWSSCSETVLSLQRVVIFIPLNPRRAQVWIETNSQVVHTRPVAQPVIVCSSCPRVLIRLAVPISRH